jgi:hypothetical protein
MSVFINRQRELSLLNQRFDSTRAEFMVIYGRRRIGKSELIDQFTNNRGIRLLAREESKTLQLRIFAQKLGEFFNDDLLKKTEFTGWDGFFEYLSSRAEDRIVRPKPYIHPARLLGQQTQKFKYLPDTVRLKHLNDGINGNGIQQPALWKKDRTAAHQADSLYPHTWLHKGH